MTKLGRGGKKKKSLKNIDNLGPPERARQSLVRMEDPGPGSNDQQSDVAARLPEVEWVWRWVSRWGVSGSCCPLRTLFLLLYPCLPGLDPGFGSTVSNTEIIQMSLPGPRCPWGLWRGEHGQDSVPRHREEGRWVGPMLCGNGGTWFVLITRRAQHVSPSSRKRI